MPSERLRLVKVVNVLAYQRETMDELAGLGGIDHEEMNLRYASGAIFGTS